MKSLNNIIESFFSNVGAKPMTLREFMVNFLNTETFTTYSKKSGKDITDDKLVTDFLDWMLDDDFDNSRKIKGVNIHKFFLDNIDKPILINADIVDGSFRKSSKPVYSYNLNVDGEEFIWFRYELYPWMPNKPKKI